ncbi:cyclin-domain-containing protein [Aspergillus avenaceus]|uniref:Cyclin-domain-containing protein n=1 Tax=Aspergillus avenaceus TaxID=36643 RepID=A0A5N6TI74_ASPAV|nr:cyclin-domain-containing protein [Aspergillus avenaceus]
MTECHGEGRGACDLSPQAQSCATEVGNGELTGLNQISPDAALDLLCIYVELLATQSLFEPGVQVVTASLPKYKAESESISSGEVTPTNTEIHCCPVGYDKASRDRVQLGILSRRFLSKRVPSITIKEYLMRLHRYCPMSTAVYLATCVYLDRMVTVEKIISINPRNVHRLVLAGLRVAMKTLEDLSYSHSRVAKVGGVAEHELSKLEISFCFLADFELRIDAHMLTSQAKCLRRNMNMNIGLHADDTHT